MDRTVHGFAESDTTERLSLALAPEMTTLKGVNKADRWGPLSSPFSLQKH